MNLADLMHGLTTGRFTIHRAGGCNDLEVRGPIARLTPEQKASLREHKLSLLHMLQLCPPDAPLVMQGPAEAKPDASRIRGAKWRKPRYDGDAWETFAPEPFPAEHTRALRGAEVHFEPYSEAERWAIEHEHLFAPPADWDELPRLPPK